MTRNPLPGVLLRYRRLVVIGVQTVLMVVANYLAFWLRFDGDIPGAYGLLFLLMLPVLVLVRQLAFIPFRLYEGLWRYTSIYDLRNIVAGVFTGTLVFYLIVQWGLGLVQYPRSVFITDSILLIFLVGGIRLLRRIHRELTHVAREKRVLIVGAGDAGEMIVRDMRNNPAYDLEPAGFVDDDPSKVGRRIHGVAVLGTRAALPDIMASIQPAEVVVAIPGAEPATIREIVKSLEPYKVPIMTVPSLPDVLNGRVAVSQIRQLSIEDLLPRPRVGLDPAPVRHLIRGRRIMVTGAGGSIGSELCHQIAAAEPAELVLYERYENGLYAVATGLQDRYPGLVVHSLIGDVADSQRVNEAMECHRPEVVFHAAAHKHVPLMELNPCEAVRNNVLGSRTLAEAAGRWGVGRFILISSDKAVHPSSVMGATKRVAEMVIQQMAGWHSTAFMAVRFGNVLGSTGSVVPRFLEQIHRGGPVTVTHPEVRRYFMLVSEAVELVLHAAAHGQPGSVYVLEMGEQVKIVDVARNLIRLAGFVPAQDIAIEFVGLRPGEKLAEELFEEGETVEPSDVAKVLIVRPAAPVDAAWLHRRIMRLEECAVDGDAKSVVELLRGIVPTFQPASLNAIASIEP